MNSRLFCVAGVLVSSPLVAQCSHAEQIWDFKLKLVPCSSADFLWDAAENLCRTSGNADHLFYLVVRTWLSCQWTYLYVVTAEDAAKLALSLEDLREVRKCGPSIRHICHFYNADVFKERLGLTLPVDALGQVLGYLVHDSRWDFGNEQICSDDGEFQVAPHPFRRWHHRSVEDWLGERLEEQGFSKAVENAEDSLAEAAARAGKSLCAESAGSTNVFDDIWNYLWPGISTAEQLIIIGCGSLNSEPTQLLLDKGSGGLFVDASSKEIKMAKLSSMAGPHRRILNQTITTSNVLNLLSLNEHFTKRVEVIQVDIDTIDGPVLLKLVDVTAPKAIVVEVRNFVPFPFRYACLSIDTHGLPWGGANLNYWMHELRLRGFEVAMMDHRDAVFVQRTVRPIEDPQWHFLGTVACYLRNVLAIHNPEVMIAEASGDNGEMFWDWLQLVWMDAAPADALNLIWRNLTEWRTDIPFSLSL